MWFYLIFRVICCTFEALVIVRKLQTLRKISHPNPRNRRRKKNPLQRRNLRLRWREWSHKRRRKRNRRPRASGTARVVTRRWRQTWWVSVVLLVLWQEYDVWPGECQWYCLCCDEEMTSDMMSVCGTARVVTRWHQIWWVSVLLLVLWQGDDVRAGECQWYYSCCDKEMTSDLVSVSGTARVVTRSWHQTWWVRGTTHVVTRRWRQTWWVSVVLLVLWQGDDVRHGECQWYCSCCDKVMTSDLVSVSGTARVVTRGWRQTWWVSVVLLVLWRGDDIRPGKCQWYCSCCDKEMTSDVVRAEKTGGKDDVKTSCPPSQMFSLFPGPLWANFTCHCRIPSQRASNVESYNLSNIGLINSLLPYCTKALPEPVLTNHRWGLMVFTEYIFAGSVQDVNPWYWFENNLKI